LISFFSYILELSISLAHINKNKERKEDGVTIAGGNRSYDQSNRLNQLDFVSDVIVDIKKN
jgi:hypothetical protein